MNVQMIIKRHILYARLEGELDQYTVSDLRLRVGELVEKYNIDYLVMNLEKLDFIDSSGIGFIIGRYNTLKKRNGSIILCNLNDQIRRIIALSGLSKICILKETEEEANLYLGVA